MRNGGIDPNLVAITLDLDWAPDYAIDLVAQILVEHEVRATWFVTHESEAVRGLRAHELFELGIHPNFASASTHGSGLETVLDHCMQLVPEATSMRTHQLFQLTPLFDLVLERTPIRSDLSLYLHRAPNLSPVAFHSAGRVLHRFPTFWQDDQAMNEPSTCWDPAVLIATPGLKVMNFHPMHVYLNSGSFDRYRTLRGSGRLLSELPQGDTTAHIGEGPGVGTLFRTLVTMLAGGATWRIRDLAQRLDR